MVHLQGTCPFMRFCMVPEAIQEQNRRSWNAAVPAHYSHHADLAAFLRAGGLSLFSEELELLGPLAGLRLAHLMCNTGQDTLSLARLGALVTGVDISDVAIEHATRLSAESGIPAQFVRMDVQDWLHDSGHHAQYDRVFCSYGAICWVADLAQFAHGVAAALAPGGRFVLVEFHPASNMFNQDWQLSRAYPHAGQRLTLHGIDDYVGASGPGLAPSGFAEGIVDFHNPEPCHLFQWGVGEVVTAVAQAGLRIEQLHEYLFVNGERPFARMQDLGDRRLTTPTDIPRIPLMYGLAASQAG